MLFLTSPMFPTLIELVDNTLFCEDTAFFSELATTIISLSCDTKLSDGCFKTEIYDIFPKRNKIETIEISSNT